MYVAHSASYGIIIKVRKQPQRGDTTDLQPVIVSPRWGFGFIPIFLSHCLCSGLIVYRPSGAHGNEYVSYPVGTNSIVNCRYLLLRLFQAMACQGESVTFIRFICFLPCHHTVP